MLSTKRLLEPISINKYKGRFAPSPSGFLHFGSLIAALASYLDAKSHICSNNKQGKWLVRIEDIDPPRELTGASTQILKTLEAFGLYWDEPVLYQSSQSQYYVDTLNDLKQQNHSYYCQCTRAEIKATGGIYQSSCRHKKQSQKNSAVRLINTQGIYQFHDIFQGEVSCNKALAQEDFIIHRKDGLFAYQLAVVLDDIEQGITHVIRGCDLLEPTSRQLTFFKTLNKQSPQYGHIPLAITQSGFKLSKQNKAAAINIKNPQLDLYNALKFLGQVPPKDIITASVDDIISWGICHWKRANVPKTTQIPLSP